MSSACAQYMCGTMHKSSLDTAQTLLKLMTALYTNLRTSSRLGKQESQVYNNKEVCNTVYTAVPNSIQVEL